MTDEHGTEIAVAIAELARCKTDVQTLGLRVDALEEKLGLLRADVRVLEQRVASWAAAGALAGDGAASLVTMAVGKLLGL